MDLSRIKGTMATDIAVSAPSFLLNTTATSMQDEEKIYQELSVKLREIEHLLEFELSTVVHIEQEVKQIFIQQNKREELLLRCKWLSTLYEIKNQIPTLTSLEKLQQYQNKLKYIQTSPLNKQLQEELEKLETTLTAVKKPEREQLEEVLFTEGYSSFINLGAKGRAFILNKTLAKDGKVPTAKILTESLEERVLNTKDLTSTEELLGELSALPLSNYSLLTNENREKVVELLLDEKGWTNLLSLDQAIRRKVQEIEPIITTTITITDTFTVDRNFFN